MFSCFSVNGCGFELTVQSNSSDKFRVKMTFKKIHKVNSNQVRGVTDCQEDI